MHKKTYSPQTKAQFLEQIQLMRREGTDRNNVEFIHTEETLEFTKKLTAYFHEEEKGDIEEREKNVVTCSVHDIENYFESLSKETQLEWLEI